MAMPPRDPVTLVARELAALGYRDRRAILGALDPEDRARIDATLRGRTDGAARTPVATTSTHSAWFDDLLGMARNGDVATMTHTARAALLDAAGVSPTPPRGPGRSLLEAAGGLLAGSRGR